MAVDTELEFRDLTPSIGAEVIGADPTRPFEPHILERIVRAWRDRLVLVFRGRPLTDPELLTFSRQFGELDPPGPNPYGKPFLPDFPDILVVSNVKDENGTPIGNLGPGELVWHQDLTYVDTPPQGTVLHGLEIPAAGGNTHFANMYAAYEDLPAALKAAIDGKEAVHDASLNSSGGLRKGYAQVTDPRQTVGAKHPLARKHPVTGRLSLFLGRRRNAYIVGMELAESEALLDELWAHAVQPRYTLAHEWKPGDIVLWDNEAALHRRDAFDETGRRIMHRAQIRAHGAPRRTAVTHFEAMN